MRQSIGDEHWQALLAPDGAAPALTYQRDFVRIAVRRATGIKPSLQHLTIGQAERILSAVSADPAPLYQAGRDSSVVTKIAVASKWVALLVVVLVAFATPGAFVVGLSIIAAVIISRMRRRARQEWEDRLADVSVLDHQWPLHGTDP